MLKTRRILNLANYFYKGYRNGIFLLSYFLELGAFKIVLPF